MVVTAYSSVVGNSAWIEISMRIGFLFKHDAAYRVQHAVPFAFELSRIPPDLEAIGSCYPGHRCRFQCWPPGPAQWLADNDHPTVVYTEHYDQRMSSLQTSAIETEHAIERRPAVAEPAAAAG